MLKTLRKNTKLVVWTVVISFALWGAYAVGTGLQKEQRMAGEIFGKAVPFQEFDRFYRASQIFSYSGSVLENPEEIKQHTWQSLLFSREARRRKIEVPDEEVRREVLRLLAAHKIENPTPELYRRWLQGTVRESPQEFESQVRELLRIQKLIAEAHDAPVEAPDTETLHRKFLLEEQKLSAEAVKFPSREEAAAFYEKVKEPKRWKKEARKDGRQLLTTGLVSLQTLLGGWQISDEDAFRLQGLEKGDVSEPVASAGQFAVFQLVDKQAADEGKFEKEFKQKYMNELTERKKNERFVQWSLELKEKANLKDYLPRPEPPGS